MGGIKHLMDDVAEELGLDDPNCEQVRVEVERRLAKLETSHGKWTPLVNKHTAQLTSDEARKALREIGL